MTNLAKYAGNIIKELRTTRNLTQEELAVKIGVGKSTIANYESGYRMPKQDLLFELADVLNVNIDVFFPDRNEKTKTTITTLYNQLEPQRQENVYNYATEQLEEQQGTYPMFETISIYGHASAGSGAILADEYSEEINYTGNVPKHDYALYVDGDSMLPLFSDGQIIFIKKTSEAYNNQIVIANLNGEGFIKKLVYDENGAKLVSLNKKYKDIIINEHDEFMVFGVVSI